MIRIPLIALCLISLPGVGAPAARAAESILITRPVPAPYQLGAWRRIEDLRWSVAQFKDVFWDPRDTPTLRGQIRTNNLARGKKVLEIGVGTGLLSLCALSAGATSVVGTDINPAAVACARYNAERFGWRQRFGVRLVPRTNSSAFAVIGRNEKFDLIISNPPWVDRQPKNDFEFALYDPGFELLKSLMEGLPRHLNPGGRVLLAYGSVSSIRTLYQLAEKHGYSVKVIDDTRKLDELPEEFLPGMTLEVIVPPEKLQASTQR